MNPEERLRLSNILRAELELPEMTLEDISTSSTSLISKHNSTSTDSSYTDTTYDSSTYGQSGVYTPNYSDPYSEENLHRRLFLCRTGCLLRRRSFTKNKPMIQLITKIRKV